MKEFLKEFVQGIRFLKALDSLRNPIPLQFLTTNSVKDSLKDFHENCLMDFFKGYFKDFLKGFSEGFPAGFHERFL